MDSVPYQFSTRFFLGWLKESIRKKGLGGLADFSVSYFSDYWFDFYYGTSTRGYLPSSKLKTASANHEHSAGYQATKSRPFKKLLSRLSFPEGSVFVDVGCGKGKALLVASRFGFTKAVGVEFSGELCQAARKNIETYQRRSGRYIDISIIESDIIDYIISPFGNVFYIYNPFGDVVLQKFLENLHRSISDAPRKVWLIYHIPLNRKVIDEQSIFPRSTDYFIGGTEFVVYEGE